MQAVVSGETTTDEWLVDRSSLDIIKRVLGAKTTEFVVRLRG